MNKFIKFYSKDSTVWVVYSSPVSWDYTLMLEINIVNETLKTFNGKKIDVRKDIIKVNNCEDGIRELNQTGTDLSLIRQALELIDGVNRDDSSFFDVLNMKIHLESSNILIQPSLYSELEDIDEDEDKKTSSVIETLTDLLKANRLTHFQSPVSQCYAGVTGDLDIRMYQHSQDGKNIPDSFGIGVLYDHMGIAVKVEKSLHELGYKGGTENEGNGARDKSCIVYIYKTKY